MEKSLQRILRTILLTSVCWINAIFAGARDDGMVLFHNLIADNYQLEVLEWKGEAAGLLQSVASETCAEFNRSKSEYDRTNELGLALEQILQQVFESNDVDCGIPTTLSGQKQFAGYPDLTFSYKGQLYYLEVKTFSSRTIDSSQRTFYFTVSENPKVIKDAFHLLIGFEIEKSNDRHYRILRYHIIDLRNLPCKVKVEYNANNRDLYNESVPGYKIVGSVEPD